MEDRVRPRIKAVLNETETSRKNSLSNNGTSSPNSHIERENDQEFIQQLLKEAELNRKLLPVLEVPGDHGDFT